MKKGSMKRPIVQELELQRAVIEKILGQSVEDFTKEMAKTESRVSTILFVLFVIQICQAVALVFQAS